MRKHRGFKAIFAGEATMVFAPASGGEIGIASRHASLLTTMKAGEVRVQDLSGEEHLFWVGGVRWKYSRIR